MEADQKNLRNEIAVLIAQHRALDAEIEELRGRSDFEQLHFQRLKKQKLHLKDRIAALEDQLLPDIIA